MAQSIGEQAKKWRCEDCRQKYQAIEIARLLQGEPLDVLKIFDRVGLPEREKNRGVQHMHTEDVPIGAVELEQVAPHDAI